MQHQGNLTLVSVLQLHQLALCECREEFGAELRAGPVVVS